ncbi:hypothetical protein D3C80_1835710 [compost metagenome]
MTIDATFSHMLCLLYYKIKEDYTMYPARSGFFGKGDRRPLKFTELLKKNEQVRTAAAK